MKTETPPVPAALSRAFPELPSIGAVHDIGQGFGSMVVETGGNIIFRIGRSAAALEGYKREMRLLPELSGRVPVPIPLPRWFAERSPDFPFGVMGYWKIQGDVLLPEHVTPVAPAGLIRGLAAMLVALHGFPAGEALALDVPRWNAQEEAEAMEDDIMAILRRLLGAEECERIAAWLDTFRADPV
ncbi:MAG: phosphotransferase family protein, partial [Chloroflexota bacterium]